MVGAEEIDVTQGSEKIDVIQGLEEIDVTQGEETKPNEKEAKPDFVLLLLKCIIDTVLMEEVTRLGLKMNAYRSILAKAVL